MFLQIDFWVSNKVEEKIKRNQESKKLQKLSCSHSSWADKVEQEIHSNAIDRGKDTPMKGKSIWENFDISKTANAGFKLEYVNPKCCDNKLIGEIDLGDISSEIEYWQNDVVCYVLGAHPPFTVLNGFIQIVLRNGIDSEEGKLEVLQGGIYNYDNKLLIVKAWTPEMEFSKEELLTSARGLSKIGSLIGKPLMVDKQTEKKLGLSYARLLVEVNVGKTLPEEVLFRNEKGVVITQSVAYDWRPSLCDHCHKYGHEKDNCRKLHPTQKPVDETKETKEEDKIQTNAQVDKGKEKMQEIRKYGDNNKRFQQGSQTIETHHVSTTNAFKPLTR
ncbi:hypothetical protein R3W88_007753 [Solanum pinnatisectum]|uniref:DUF4283 domain-containing protein n=1 Tax=Solanum pinnatisectum TaxID=50273 RepID=A0AAV9M6K9_9SOLN|nr:hypothetical protein R3W88_007753 [Solanum pinnatisectum]